MRNILLGGGILVFAVAVIVLAVLLASEIQKANSALGIARQNWASINAKNCKAMGGSSWNYCPDTGQGYCCGVCNGHGSCASNSGLDACACPIPFTDAENPILKGTSGALPKQRRKVMMKKFM
jgi:hypothetical protein